MIQAALTPVERGILFILMAHSQPLKQTDLQHAHGLSVKKTHRLKLEDRGLIQAAGKRPFTLTLTQKGRAWVEAELSAPKQKGALGLGPLRTVLGVIDELTKRPGQPLEDGQARNGSGASPAGADIREPEWIEADELLARALQDISVFSAALSRLREAAKGTLEHEIRRTELSANLVFQNVRVAAKKRGLDLDGAVGSEASFDPVFFYSDEDIELGAPVRIRKSPVTRGQGKKKVIIQLGLAEAIHS